MTCIVALKTNDGSILMGADSAGVGGLSLSNRKDPKIYRVGEMLIGFTSSYRMGQLLGYSLILPDFHSEYSIDKYMNTMFINAVRDCLKEGGYAKKENEVEQAGFFLVAFKGRIFSIGSDYQVGECFENYDSVGCGSDLALGSLFTSENEKDDIKRINKALEAAARFSAGVRAPFIIEKLDGLKNGK